MTRIFHVADDEAIRKGEVTDIYYKRTKDIVTKKGLANERVVMDVHAYSLPKNYEWAVLAGIEEVAHLLENLQINVRTMEEGTVFRLYEPVLSVEGPYGEFGILESTVLGLLRQASAIATKAARCKKVADGKTVIFFGIRALHPAITPMADRSAFIGGCDAVSGTYGAKLIGEEPVGTIPHELILLFGDQTKALKAFDDVVAKDVSRIALCDTWFDERVEALLAADTLKERLYGVRFDTPFSRRGDIRRIVEEVRWTLDLHGYKNVKIFLSSGMDEYKIPSLIDVADGFGVGTSIACAPSIDFAFDIVEAKGKPISKKGKLPGRKEVYRCKNCFHDEIVPANVEVEKCSVCGGKIEKLLKPLIKDGKIVRKLPKPREIREYVLKQLEKFPLPPNVV